MLHSSLLPVLFLLSSLVALPSGAQPGTVFTKHGCQSRCGDLQVPYPFGIGMGTNCSISSPWFDIRCDTSFNPPKPYLAPTPIEVVNISDSKIYVRNQKLQLARTCYGADFNVTPGYSSFIDMDFFVNSPHTLSDANQITAVGCDDLATGHQSSNLSGAYASGIACVPYCNSREDLGGIGSCPGNGCCRMSLPRGQKYLMVKLSDMSVNWMRAKLFPCSFSFVGKMDNLSFSFPLSDLNDSTTFLNNTKFMGMPLVLDWGIGSRNCSQVQNSSDYACQRNSYCIDSDTGAAGYRCRCRGGYDGNPYLSPGCQDINECKNNPCHTNSICINKPGSYECSCPEGYIGDGNKDGRGCIRVPGSQSKVAIVAALGGGMGLLLLLSTCFWFHKALKKRENKRRREKFFKRNGGLLLQQQISTNEYILDKTKLFSAKDLEKATDLFNESRVLGRGGFGTVYKGMLSDGKIVAIKKSKLEDENQVEQFINEVVILSQINHRNVVKLLGCCLETEVPLLVYEFIPNGTLFDLIHDNSGEFPFTWNMRLKIAVEVAGALAHLHYASSVPIYHRDIKSSNVLLDEKYVAKVSDFGTSRSIAVDQTHLTTLVKGTFGYLDPEYFQTSQFTEKSDVYSYGVVLVELLTGKRPISSDRTQEERSLATRFLLCMEANNLETILDPQVIEQRKSKELIAVAKLAQKCLCLNGKNRPTMKEVVVELEGVKISQSHSTAEETKLEEVNFNWAKLIPMSDDDYTWTSTIDSTVTSSDASPLIINTV